jgi:uncharacterized membrane protein
VREEQAMNMYPFYQWCDETRIGQFIAGNTWSFPLTETLHIMALAIMFGCIFLIDLRLLGVEFGGISHAKMYKELHRYINWSTVIIIITGIMLFLSEATKAYANDAFRPKVILLVIALIFHYAVFVKAVRNDALPGNAKMLGALSLILWFSVGAAGRAIGFV